MRVDGRRPAVAVILALVLSSACGGGDGNGNGTPTPTGQQTTPGETVAPGQRAGRMIQVIESLARIGGSRAAAGDELFGGSVLTTDERGRATFSVLDVLEDCQIQIRSRLVVAPAPRVPLELEQGNLICRSKPGEDEFQIAAGQAIVGFLDPIFQVQVTGARSEVRVDFGFVQVRRSARGSPGVLVGPGGQLAVSRGAMPDRATTYRSEELDRFDRQAIERQRRALPALPRGLPSTGSETVGAIRSADRLQVGVDEAGSGRVGQFAQGLVGALAGRWGVGSNVGEMDHEDASRELASGGLEAYISPQVAPGAARMSLFDDERGRTWSLWVMPDSVFQGALELMLKALLDNGDYGRAYAGAFGAQPDYEVLRALVYPTREQASRSQWQPPTEAAPTPSPTASPTPSPTASPTASPTQTPTIDPSLFP